MRIPRWLARVLNWLGLGEYVSAMLCERCGRTVELPDDSQAAFDLAVENHDRFFHGARGNDVCGPREIDLSGVTEALRASWHSGLAFFQLALPLADATEQCATRAIVVFKRRMTD